MKKTVDDGTPETTVYIGGIYEKNTTSGVVTKNYRFGGRRIAMRQGGTLSYLLADHLGSTSTVLNAAGGVVGSQKYYPFGRTRSGDVPTDKLFTGHQREGSLYFMQARFYDPTLGRFLSPDSIVPGYGNPQALNRYSYVLNNPLRYTDPTGHYPILGTGFDDPRHFRPPVRPSSEVTGSLELYPLATTGTTSALQRNPWVLGGIIALGVCIEFCPLAGEGLYEGLSGGVGVIAEGGRSLGCRIPFVSCSDGKAGDEAGEIPPVNWEDPSKSPGPEWEWRGKLPRGGTEGRWYNGKTGESLHPDLKHLQPKGPHFGWRDRNGDDWDIFPDGRIEPNP